MTGFIRMVRALLAILCSLPLIASSLTQATTKLGYPQKPEEAIWANYLEGDAAFIDAPQSDHWLVGYGREELTPADVDCYNYFVAGFLKFPAREASGVLDGLFVRAVVLDDGSGRGAAAFAWVDGVGLMNADIKSIRKSLADITGDGMLKSIDVGSTHTHSGIDTQGLWGNIPRSGRDPKYMDALIEKTAAAIRTAFENRTAGTLYYAAAPHPEMFKDNRDPQVFDDVVRLMRFVPENEGREIWIANFGAHPVNLGWGNSLLSGDYPYYIEKSVREIDHADFMFIQGAIGGGIGCATTGAYAINEEAEGADRLTAYCVRMSDILRELAAAGEPVKPILNVRHMQAEFEVDNFVFKLAERAKIANANAYLQDGRVMLSSEIGYMEIGEHLKVLQIPGEALPELILGGFYSAEQAYNHTEYDHPALKTLFAPDDDITVFGLCNDALGYFVPDNDYCASNEDGHYEETVSTGSHSASALSAAFEALIGEWGN